MRSFKGALNPNWKGGPIDKICQVCSKSYTVKQPQRNSRFCSLQCVGISQRKSQREWAISTKKCLECAGEFSVPASHAHRHFCCSRACGGKRRAKLLSGEGNPHWNGGISRLPYPWDFTKVTSKSIISRDGEKCQNPTCRGKDKRLTAHHVNYVKSDCRPINLITLCSSCNSRANFGRDRWQIFYAKIMALKHGGGWAVEEF